MNRRVVYAQQYTAAAAAAVKGRRLFPTWDTISIAERASVLRLPILTGKQIQTLPYCGCLVEELCGRIGAFLGDAATAAIHLEATAEWIRAARSVHPRLVVAGRTRLRLAPRSLDAASSRSIVL